MTTYNGVLVFHSETGTEGGWYAFQDEKFMGLENRDVSCTRCGRVWNGEGEPPKPSFVYWVDREGQKTPEGYSIMSGYMGFDEPQDLPLDRNGATDSFDAQWQSERNATALECYTKGHEGWEPLYPNGMWSYEGLHRLENGDKITVRHPGSGEVCWEGVIDFTSHKLFTEDVHGLWVNQAQVGVDQEEWSLMFIKSYPVTVEQL